MKGKYLIVAGALLSGMAGTSLWALSRHSGETLENVTVLKAAPGSVRKAQAANAASTTGTPYWTTAASYYKDGEVDPDNAPVREFATHIEINGDEATIYGLVDFYFDEVDQEYPVKGKYNERAGTITIEGTAYDSDKTPGEFIKLADMYSLSDNTPYSLMLFAGDMWGSYLETIDQLVLRVSEDLTTVYAENGYGAYAFSSSGSTMGFYDYYQPGVSMKEATPDGGMAFSTDTIDFNGLFIATGMPVSQTIYLYNRSSLEASFEISSSSPDITLSSTSGTIPACSSRALEVNLTASEPGMVDATLTLTTSANPAPVEARVNVEVWEQPDYTKITKAGSEKIEFDMSPVYPFIITEYEGHVAARSTNNGKGNGTVSYFVCKVEVPDGKVGMFSWDAMQITQQPNTLTVYLDGEPVKYDYYVLTSEPIDMSGVLALTAGDHEIIFAQDISMDWSMYGDISEGYVWNLNFQLADNKPNLGYMVEEEVDFGTTFYDGVSVEMSSEVTVINLGTETLKVTGVVGEGNFSGSVPSITVPQGGEITVPLTWNASAIGVDTGAVTVKTTGGDFTVNCHGTANTLPYDYSKFVTEGNISFNTDPTWPFKISDNQKYLYNSTSKTDIDGVTDSWIEAIFEVPEGQVGFLSWDAINDSEELFTFMGIPSIISGSSFTIDGGDEELVGGSNVNCGSKDLYTADQLTFRAGRHSVRFLYHKTANDESHLFGDDRLKIFEIGLHLEDVEGHKASISTTEIEFPKNVFIGCAGHCGVMVNNYTTLTPQLTGSESDGPFQAKVGGIYDNNMKIVVEFVPEAPGDYSDVLKIHTNIGDFEINCKGTAEESDLGKAIFYEGYEYDFESNWTITDANADENSWTRISPYIVAFNNQNLIPYDGSEGLLLKGYDPTTFSYFDTDDYATTPYFTIPSDGVTTLRLMACSSWAYNDQTLDILVGEGDDLNAYTLVKTLIFDTQSPWEAYTADLSDFAGKRVKIAFRGREISQFIAIDDVLVASTGSSSAMTTDIDRTPLCEEYYDTYGRRLAKPSTGVNIVVTRYSDGTATTEKRMVK